MLGASTSLRPAAPPASGRRGAPAPRAAPPPPPPPRRRAPQPPRALRPADADLGPTVLEPYLGAPVPTRLNTTPHSRETRRHFYAEAAAAVGRALAAGETRVAVRATFPELNTEFDVYRVGTLLEMVREIAGAAAAAGRPRVRVCVQQALGAGVFQGTPLSLSGVSRILGSMEWGDAGGLTVTTGNLGAREVEGADALLLVAPQNVQGHSVLPLLEETAAAAAAAGVPLVLVNAKLGDIPSSGGIMGVRGREARTAFVDTFRTCYHFRLLYRGAAAYPIMGALRHAHGGPWEVLRREDFAGADGAKAERYALAGAFGAEPGAEAITSCFRRAR